MLNFRNFSEQTCAFSSDGAIILGVNGSGKTNLLEAIHLLCTGRSQRGASKKELVHTTSSQPAFIEGEFRSTSNESEKTEASVAIDPLSGTLFRCNQKKITAIKEWFGQRPVVSLGPRDIDLVTGGPGERRRFIDMLLCQLDPEYLDNCIAYAKHLHNRNILLHNKTYGLQLDVYEEKMVEHGAFLLCARSVIMQKLCDQMAGIYRNICQNDEYAQVVYKPVIPYTSGSLIDWKNVFYTELKKARNRDCMRGFSTCGPHRDDLEICLCGVPAKQFASQGQCRSLALSLRLLAFMVLKERLSTSTIVCVDDALSDLDEARSGAVFSYLYGKCQLFITALTTPGRLPKNSLPTMRVSQGTITTS